ncbi:ribosome rescue protein RqcH [[Eubacterium] cellulosolvens]
MDDLKKKSVMTSFDIYTVVNELEPQIIEKTIDNIYQLKDKLFSLKLTPGNLQLLIEPEKRIHLTKYQLTTPSEPPQFCRELRKHLRRAKITGVNQYRFERVVILDIKARTSAYQLIAEIFRRGNLILVNASQQIVTAQYYARMKDRRIGRGEMYKPIYASGIEPQHLAISDIQKIQDEEKNVFKGLHKILPFPPNYVKEVLHRTGLNETTEFSKIDKQKPEELFNIIRRIYDEHHSTKIKPRVVLDPGGKAIDVTPTRLQIYEKYPQQEFQTFNEALDEYFSSLYLENIQKESTSPQKSKIEEIERIITSLTEEKKNVKKDINWNIQIGNLIQKNILVIQNLITKMDANKPLIDLKKEHANQIIELDNKNKRMKTSLFGFEFWINYSESAYRNAGIYFNNAKNLRKKLEGVKSSLSKMSSQLQTVETQLIQEKKEEPTLKVKRKKEWYEKFRWFWSSNGFLILIGKDAGTNQLLIERYTTDGDIIFHADLHGAPFTVIKTEGETVPEQTLLEAAIASASYSRAWAAGYSSADVYWVAPEQLSKKPPSGEYLARGMYMVYGPRHYYKGVKLQLALGVIFTDDAPRIIGGPIDAVKSKTSIYVTIIPMQKGQRRFSQEILQRLIQKAPRDLQGKIKNIDLNEIQAFVPAGKGEII